MATCCVILSERLANVCLGSIASSHHVTTSHNPRINDELYNGISMTEVVNSSVKRSDGSPVRAREWYSELRMISDVYCI